MKSHKNNERVSAKLDLFVIVQIKKILLFVIKILDSEIDKAILLGEKSDKNNNNHHYSDN